MLFRSLTEVPIAFPRAGGLCITYPVAVDDECLVVFADACIDFWWQSGGIQSPKDSRSHDLSDAIAIFGLSSQPRKLPSVSANAIEIRTDSRSDYISLTAGKLDIQINGETNVTANKSTVVLPFFCYPDFHFFAIRAAKFLLSNTVHYPFVYIISVKITSSAS